MLNLVGDAVNGSILECGLEKPAGRKHLPVFALFVIGQKGKRSQPKQMDVGSADKSVKRCKLLVKNSASHSSNGVSESPRYSFFILFSGDTSVIQVFLCAVL